MTDKDRYIKLSFLIVNVVKQITELPPPSYGKCACSDDGFCAHHAAVFSHLCGAKCSLELAQRQLQYPNGIGDKAAFPSDKAQTEALRLSLLLEQLRNMAANVRELALSYDGDEITIRSYIEQAEDKLHAAIQTTQTVLKSL